MGGAHHRNCLLKDSTAATQIVLALNAYTADHGGATANQLSDLVPTYLRAIPTDPWGAAYEIDADKKNLLSSGQTGVFRASYSFRN